MGNSHKALGVSLIALSAAASAWSPASATEGYFQHGYGARQSALAGAGVADSRDSMALSINPAGLVHVDHQIQGSLSLFSPHRKFTGSGGPGFTPSGAVESGSESFPVPSFGYAVPLDDFSVLSVAAYGNGGMNTSYDAVANPACASPPLPAPNGVFCGGAAGVNLNQLFISAGYAREVTDRFSLGVAPIFAIQAFEAQGLAAFAYDAMANPLTVDPSKLTDNETDYSTGFGVRVGAEFALTDRIRLGASYKSKVYMSKFKDYAGLFENGGDFDIPESYTVGLAFDATPDLTVMLDYRRINYSGVDAVGNSPLTPAQFGSKGGPGFGWKDVDAVKLGVEWRANDAWTLRGGYAHNNNPISGDDVTLNILAPGVQEDHVTGGFSWRMNSRNALDFGAMYSPSSSVSGIEITPAGPNPGHQIELEMNQYELTVGWTHTFGG
jgi:long-chain fatty acid transport protein